MSLWKVFVGSQRLSGGREASKNNVDEASRELVDLKDHIELRQKFVRQKAQKLREEVNRGVRPSGKKFRL